MRIRTSRPGYRDFLHFPHASKARNHVPAISSSLSPGRPERAARPLSQELARAAASLALIAGAALAAAPTAVLAQATESRRGVAIAAGPLSQALNAYASAAGVELTMDASLLQGKRSAGLSGSYTVAEGFAELLRGQGLRAAREATELHAQARAAAGRRLAGARDRHRRPGGNRRRPVPRLCGTP